MIYSVESVSKIYRQGRASVCALNGVTLKVTRGEHIALLGHSGAGKSTLFRLLNATIRPSTGAVIFEGRDVAGMSGTEVRGVRRRIGTIYQQHNLVPSLTALENTLCGGLGRWSLRHTIRGIVRPHKPDLDKALDALESVGLADKRQARADELSGGQQQRVAIARTLMQDPEVILADEPVASLDPGLSDEIISLLTRLAAGGQRTLVVSLHTVALALERFPRAIALRSGSVVFDGRSSEVRDDLLKHLYAGGDPTPGQAQHGAGFRSEFNCIG